MATANQHDEQREAMGVVQQVVADVTTLIRHEIELAKTELGGKIKAAGIGAGMLSASAVSGLITLACLTAVGALLLALVLPAWIAVLIVTILWAVVTAALAIVGKRKVENAAPFVPEQTIENIKEDLAWARRRAK